MKKCKHCESLCDDHAEKCPNCNGNEFYIPRELTNDIDNEKLRIEKERLRLKKLGIFIGAAATIIAALLARTIVTVIVDPTTTPNSEPSYTSTSNPTEPPAATPTPTPEPTPTPADTGLVYLWDLVEVEYSEGLDSSGLTVRGLEKLDLVTGIDGTQYYSGFSGGKTGFFVGNTSATWNKYLLNKQFSELQFDIILSSIQHSDSWVPNISIYGDDKLLYSIDIEKTNVDPINVSVDVSNVTYLQVKMDCVYLESYGYAASIVDVRLEK